MKTERTTPAPSSATSRFFPVAVAEPPVIVCPPWCVIPTEAHVADLANQEGYVIHWSDLDADIRHSAVMTPAGVPDPTETPLVFVDCHVSDGISLERAERLAAELLAAVKEARA